MQTISNTLPINLKVVRFELDFTPPTAESMKPKKPPKKIFVPDINPRRKMSCVPLPPRISNGWQSRGVEELIEELLEELYSKQRDWSGSRDGFPHRCTSSAGSYTSSVSTSEKTEAIERSFLEGLSTADVRAMVEQCRRRMRAEGSRLARHLRMRDRLRRHQKRLSAAVTVLLRHASGDSSARFSVSPGGGGAGGGAGGEGEGGFGQWLHAMRLVARLPAGVPQHFRKKLWLTLAERHLSVRGVDWAAAERACFRGTAQPEDTELGAQIVKDLHRTGCSLFCGAEGRENQAMLRRVLLAYARWNKDVGYCQGFNMLAAIILEVMDKSESDSLKVMIYLVEAVLPEGYFADDLRGLSADMAAFRDLLRIRLPRLAQHMDRLQRASDGGGVEPPLPDVFTMQWFLTLYATWLPRGALLRVWDLVFLDGNQLLLLTALAIWDLLQDRILSARSADEFYSCMGGGAGEVYAAGEALVARVVALGDAPELPRLRDLHRYRVSPPVAPHPPPPASRVQPSRQSAVRSVTKRGLKLFYSEDEGDSSDDGNRMALATVNPPRVADTSAGGGAGDRLSLDIGALKRQYARLRERQRQAHVILAAACARHAAVGASTAPTSLTVNHLLLGKSAIVSSRGRRLGPPPGAVPPSRRSAPSRPSRTRSDDTISWKEERHHRTLIRRDSIKWKDIKKVKDEGRKASLESDEAGDGVIVSEIEADKIMSAMRSRSMSESSSYSSRSASASSTDTSLCDENIRASDLDSDPASLDDNGTADHQPLDYANNQVEEELVRISPDYDKANNDGTARIDTPGNTFKDILENPAEKSPENRKQVLDETIFQSDKFDSSALSKYSSLSQDEQLRNYLEEFELKTDTDRCPSTIEPMAHNSNVPELCTEVLEQNVSEYERDSLYKTESTLHEFEFNLNKDPSNVSDNLNEISSFLITSPLDISQSRYKFDFKSSYSDICCTKNFLTATCESYSSQPRPPDIIDSFIKSPNFVPDINISDKNVSDIDSPLRSPGGESIVISEDEPPIPLKIDKYFEHSPEFFGARQISGMQSSNQEDIPNRRSQRRLSRLPKKPDTLMLQYNLNEKFQNKTDYCQEIHESNYCESNYSDEIINLSYEESKHKSPKAYKPADTTFRDSLEKVVHFKSSVDAVGILESGRRNSERALQIIQENSKILNRILTKQIAAPALSKYSYLDNSTNKFSDPSMITSKIMESPVLKGSASDSFINLEEQSMKTDLENGSRLLRLRPTSLDEPTSTALLKALSSNKETSSMYHTKSPSSHHTIGSRTDIYGWENKGFLAKCENYEDIKVTAEAEIKNKLNDPSAHIYNSVTEPQNDYSINKISDCSKPINDISKCDIDLTCIPRQDHNQSKSEGEIRNDNYEFSQSSNYSECVLSRASDICSRTLDRGPKVCENLSKANHSQASDFAFVVTSSVSFSYERSADDSPTAAKSNSSDTLCQITSLDQISTPISPKIFPKDTPTPKEPPEKMISDDTSSQITSLIETETASSLSYPRSPSSGSHHPFPARPAIRMPKELGVRLGLYSRDSLNSLSK